MKGDGVIGLESLFYSLQLVPATRSSTFSLRYVLATISSMQHLFAKTCQSKIFLQFSAVFMLQPLPKALFFLELTFLFLITYDNFIFQ